MLRQRSIFSLIMSILQQVIGFIGLYFVSRYMGPEPLGVISAALAFSLMFTSFADLGYGLAHIKKVSEGKDLASCNATFLLIELVLTGSVGIIAVLVYLGLLHSGKGLPIPAKFTNVFFIVLMSQLIGSFAQTFQYTFAARLEKAKEWFSAISSKIVTSLLKAFTAIAGLGVIYLAWANLAGMLVSFFISLWFFRRLPFGKPDLALFKEYTRFAIPSFFISISSILAMQIDKVFISMLSNVENVGYYTAAQALVRVVTFISVIFVGLLIPTFSKLHSEGNIIGIRLLAQRIEHYISFPLMALGMFIFFFSAPIQQVFLGEKFVPSALIIKLLVVNSMLLIFAQPYTSQIIGMNRIKLATVLSVLELILNILLYVVFIPKSWNGFQFFGMGAAGAATALLVSNFCATSAFRYYSFRLSGSKPNFEIFIHLLCAVFVFGILYFFLKDMSWLTNFAVLSIIALIGAFIYLTLLILIKQFKRSDFIYYMGMLNIKKLGKYVIDELNG